MTKKKKRDTTDESDNRVRLMFRLVGHLLSETTGDKVEAYTVISNILADVATGSEKNREESIHAIHTTYLHAMLIANAQWDAKESDNTGGFTRDDF